MADFQVTGNIRIPNAASYLMRNQNDNADFTALSSDGSANLLIGHASMPRISFVSGPVIDFPSAIFLGNSSFLSLATSPAQSGTIRLANASSIVFRNAANNADIPILSFATSDIFDIGDPSAPTALAHIRLRSPEVSIPAGRFAITGSSPSAFRVSDGTSTLVFGVDTTTSVINSNTILAITGSGYALLNEAASGTNPTLIPRRGDLTTGFGGADNEGDSSLVGIVEGATVLNMTPGGVTITTPFFQLAGNMRVIPSADEVQMEIRGFSTQTANIFEIRQSDTDPVMLVSNAGDITIPGGIFTGPAPPATGGLGVSNQRWIVWRNNGNNSDIETLRVDFNDATVLNTAPGENLLLQIGNTTQLDISTNLAVFTGTVRGVLSGAYALLNEASTETNPTLIPNRDNLTTGIGGLGGNITIVLGGQNRFEADGNGISFFGGTPAVQAAAYTRTATIVESRTLAANASASIANNNSVLAALIADLQAYGLLQ